jgi:transposase
MKNTLPYRSHKATHGHEGQVATTTSAPQRYQLILLGVDTHGQQNTFARKIDQLGCQPAQQLAPQRFLEFLRKQLALAQRVVMVYEAGPYGFALYRQATALGVECLVCAPEKLNRGRKCVNDKIDARELLSRLDRYLAGNGAALRLVRPPTLEQELLRRQSRERDTYLREQRRWRSRGRSLLHSMGVMRPGRWWDPERRAQLLDQIGQRYSQAVRDQVGQELDHDLELLQMMTGKLEELTKALCVKPAPKPRGKAPSPDAAQTAQPAPPRIRGIGVLSSALLDREMVDWHRFNNRRQVASYTGLCPGESSSGQSQMHLSIDKHGNPRVRAVLTELAWLLPAHQPGYIRLKRWQGVLEKGSKASKALRKKATVALARQLAVDLWRVKTGRTTPAKLGLTVAA